MRRARMLRKGGIVEWVVWTSDWGPGTNRNVWCDWKAVKSNTMSKREATKCILSSLTISLYLYKVLLWSRLHCTALCMPSIRLSTAVGLVTHQPYLPYAFFRPVGQHQRTAPKASFHSTNDFE